eukprot:1766199-Rhodomonas_salina.1
MPSTTTGLCDPGLVWPWRCLALGLCDPVGLQRPERQGVWGAAGGAATSATRRRSQSCSGTLPPGAAPLAYRPLSPAC